jgi:uncharacterized metal-binding protein YceD (DUF177 family)
MAAVAFLLTPVANTRAAETNCRTCSFLSRETNSHAWAHARTFPILRNFLIASASSRSRDKFDNYDEDISYDEAAVIDCSPCRRQDMFSDVAGRSDVVSKGLCLDKRDIEAASGVTGRTVRLRRRSTLGEVGADEYGDVGTAVDVSLAIQPVRDNFRVIGRVETEVKRICDRCVVPYTGLVSGGFEVWLTTTPEGLSRAEEREVEAVESFLGPRARVNLAPHVHDSICLCLPTRAICGDSCLGLTLPSTGLLDDAGRIVEGDGGIVDGEANDMAATSFEAASVDMLQKKFKVNRQQSS